MITMTNASTATKQFESQINDLISDTFGFSFDKWHSRGLWNDDYERYSIIENNIMLSNVSVYKMKMLINGIERECLQLGSVSTREEYRGKGLSRKIMEHIIDIYSDKCIYLHGDNEAYGFYKKLGFKPFEYKQPYIQCKLTKTKDMVKLDINDPRVDAYLKERKQYSQILDCKNQYEINWFHLIYMHSNNIYQIPELDIMLAASQNENVLTIYDIAAKNTIEFEQIKKYLYFEGVNIIKFGFNPDWLKVNYITEEYRDEASTPFIIGDFKTDNDYIIPMLIMT